MWVAFAECSIAVSVLYFPHNFLVFIQVSETVCINVCTIVAVLAWTSECTTHDMYSVL